MSPETMSPADLSQPGVPEATVQAILQALHGLRYGQVTVIVQDGRVMQIDRTDRFRLPATDIAPSDAGRRSGSQ